MHHTLDLSKVFEAGVAGRGRGENPQREKGWSPAKACWICCSRGENWWECGVSLGRSDLVRGWLENEAPTQSDQ